MLKGVKDNVYNKINKIKEDIENFNKYDERYNNIQNQIFTLKENLLNSINYLNRTGANLKIIRNYNNTSPDNMKNILENFNYKNTSSNETTQGFSKKNKNNADIDYFGISEGENNNINDSEKNNKIKNYIHVNNNIYDEENAGNIYTKEKNKRIIKTAKYIESDITRYIKGEITADEIGISTHHQQPAGLRYVPRPHHGEAEPVPSGLLLHGRRDCDNGDLSHPRLPVLSLAHAVQHGQTAVSYGPH